MYIYIYIYIYIAREREREKEILTPECWHREQATEARADGSTDAVPVPLALTIASIIGMIIVTTIIASMSSSINILTIISGFVVISIIDIMPTPGGTDGCCRHRANAAVAGATANLRTSTKMMDFIVFYSSVNLKSKR